MNAIVYANRQDETPLFEAFNKAYGHCLSYTPEMLTEANYELARGCEAVFIVVGCRITESLAEKLAGIGVKYILTRAAGTDHLDRAALARLGLRAANVPAYSPNAVSEHTVMLLLALLRKLKTQLNRVQQHNYTIGGLRGRELRALTAGVIGPGKIGSATLENLKGFGCRLLATGRKNRETGDGTAFVPLEELLSKSDAVLLHCPLTNDSYHMINDRTLSLMKPGSLLINTSRGGLVNGRDVLKALESGHLGGFAFDVYEGEEAFCRKDLKGGAPGDPVFEKLLSLDNVLYTTHTAFYTNEAVSGMIGTSFENLHAFLTQGLCENEVTDQSSF